MSRAKRCIALHCGVEVSVVEVSKAELSEAEIEIDLEKAQGYPGRYLEHFSIMNRAPAYAEYRESTAEPGFRIESLFPPHT